ncbi:MAG TPA: trigger factor [Limnochordales bacterium]
MSVKATVHPLEGSKVSLEVEVPAETVRRSMDEAYRRLAQRVRVPGFRPGRVPPEVLRARLGVQPVYDEALDILLPQAYREAVEQSGLEPVEDPRIDIVQMEEDKPLVFKAEVTVKPEVTLGTYRGVKVERVVRRVSDADVDRVLRRLQEQLAVLEPVDQPVQRGLYVEVDYDALLDGRPFRGGAARGRTLEVGSEQVLPGFDAAIEGMRPGEQRQFELDVPADYPVKDLAGKRLAFTVTVQSVKAKRLPAIDDELAQQVGGYADLGELKAAIRRSLEASADRKGRAELRRRVVERVTQEAKVEVPEPMLRRRTDRLLRELAERLAAQGLTVERYLELTGRSASELVQSLEPEARRQLVEEMVIDAIARQESIEPDPAEVERRVEEVLGPIRGRGDAAQLSERRRRQEQARQQQLAEDVRESVRIGLRRERTVAWLVEQAEVTEREEEGLGEDEAAELTAVLEVQQQATGEPARPEAHAG